MTTIDTITGLGSLALNITSHATGMVVGSATKALDTKDSYVASNPTSYLAKRDAGSIGENFDTGYDTGYDIFSPRVRRSSVASSGKGVAS